MMDTNYNSWTSKIWTVLSSFSQKVKVKVLDSLPKFTSTLHSHFLPATIWHFRSEAFLNEIFFESPFTFTIKPLSNSDIVLVFKFLNSALVHWPAYKLKATTIIIINTLIYLILVFYLFIINLNPTF